MSKPKKSYGVVEQGFKVLCCPDKPDVDIVAVPGLGANPETSWEPDNSKTKFNWLSSEEEGLHLDFPRARILLYQYESAWAGPLRVKQFLGNIASTLLHGLQVERGDCPRRPIVFIGHSMGGLVIAKAVVLAESRRDYFSKLFETIAGCIFFGTPFGGAPVAAAACMLAQIGERFDRASSSQLLDLMKPENEGLQELRNEFLRLTRKASPNISIFCFYEEQPTDFTKLAGLPRFFGLLQIAVPDSLKEFVSPTSAKLEGTDSMGLASNHRNLVKFSSFKDARYQLIRNPLKKIVNAAASIVKGHLNSFRETDREMVKNVRNALEGPISMRIKRHMLMRTVTPSSWVANEKEYKNWLYGPASMDALWITGPEGRGKTGTSLSALADIEARISADEAANPDQNASLVAYFFCDRSMEDNSAEGLMKSLLYQLVNQQEALAGYAKQMVKKSSPKDIPKDDAAIPVGSSASNMQSAIGLLSVENLWQSFQEMLSDDLVSTVYIVINNLHALPEDADSTKKLLAFLKLAFQPLEPGSAAAAVAADDDDDSGRASRASALPKMQPRRLTQRWLFTGRETHAIKTAFRSRGMRIVDLSDSKYGNQVQMELHKHAKQRVSELSKTKHYKKDLAFFASSLIGKRAQNTQWIDLACVQLAALPPEERPAKVRVMLESVPQDLGSLLDRAWLSIFDSMPDSVTVETTKEMLRALVLAYEDPTEAELALLTEMDAGEAERTALHQSIEMCRPLVDFRKASGRAAREVVFVNSAVKKHMQDNKEKLLGLSDDGVQRHHGIIALRSFQYVLERFSRPEGHENVGSGVQGQEEEEHPQEAKTVEVPGETDTPEANAPEPQSVSGTETAAQKHDSDHPNPQQKTSQTVSDDKDLHGKTLWDMMNQSEDDPSGEGENNDSMDGSDTASDANAQSTAGNDKSKKTSPDIKSTGKSSGNSENAKEKENEPKTDQALDYAVKHWLHHASKATADIAELISLEETFWKPGSKIRNRWLIDYNRHVPDLVGFSPETLMALHVAAAVGFSRLVVALLKNGHQDEREERDSLLNCPLHLAAYFGRLVTVTELLNHGAAVDGPKDVHEMTPLQMAAMKGHAKVMAKLLEQGADPNYVCKREGPVINCAILSGSRESVTLLIKYGATLSQPDTPDGVDVELSGYYPPLALATSYADATFFEFLLESGAGKLSTDVYDEALWYAAFYGRFDIFTRLLQFEHPQHLYQEMLDKAAGDPRWDVVESLLQHCHELDCSNAFAEAATAYPDSQDHILDAIWEHTHDIPANVIDTALYKATDMERLSTVRLLLDKEKFSANPNATGEEYGNALTGAAYDGTDEIVRVLIEAGANVNAPEGWALQIAALQGHVEVVRILLAEHAEVDAVIENEHFPQNTAMLAACEMGHLDIVKLLLDNHADPNLKIGAYGRCPLLVATSKGEAEIVKELVSRGADVNVVDGEDQSTPLINAGWSLMWDSVELLLNAGAHIDAVDSKGYTATLAAADTGDDETLQGLLARGADMLHVNADGLNALQVAVQNEQERCTTILVWHYSALLKNLSSQASQASSTPLGDALRTAAQAATTVSDIPSDDDDDEDDDDESGGDSGDGADGDGDGDDGSDDGDGDDGDGDDGDGDSGDGDGDNGSDNDGDDDSAGDGGKSDAE